MILLPRYRTSQPQGNAEINWGNPITRGLVSAYLPNTRFPAIELVTGVVDSATTRLSVGPGTRGVKGFNAGASTNWGLNFSWTTRWPHPNGVVNYPGMTVFALYEQYDTTSIGNIFGGGATSSLYARFVKNNDGSIYFVPNTNSGTPSVINGPVLDTDRVYALSAVQQGIYRELFVDAVSVASANTSITFLNNQYTFAGSTGATSSVRRIGLYCGYVWTRRLLNSEIKSLTDNPWQIFKPQPVIIPVQTGGAAAFDISVTPASYDLTASSASLLGSFNVSSAPANYDVTGNTGSLLGGFSLATSEGAYSVDGQAAQLAATRYLGVDPENYHIHGRDAHYELARVIGVTPISYTVNGSPVSLIKTGVIWPAESDVRYGVQYGPTGADYTGTFRGAGQIWLRRR